MIHFFYMNTCTRLTSSAFLQCFWFKNLNHTGILAAINQWGSSETAISTHMHANAQGKKQRKKKEHVRRQ